MAPDSQPPSATGAKGHLIESLGLTRRVTAPLHRCGIHTIEALAHLTDAELIQIPRIGAGSILKIRATLARWHDGQATAAPEEPTLADEWSLSDPLRSDRTDIRALRLPLKVRVSLARHGITTVAGLAGLSASEALALPAIGPKSLHLIRDALADYTRLNSAPLLPGPSAHAPLEQAVAAWLARLSPRQREAVRLRYGLVDGEPRLLSQVAAFLNVTPQCVSQYLRLAHLPLRDPPLAACIRASADALHRFLGYRRGLASFQELREEMPPHLEDGDLPPLAACSLLAALEPGFRWRSNQGVLAQAHLPTDQVNQVRQAARRIASKTGRTVAPAELLPALHARYFYRGGSPEARDAFFRACIRTDPSALPHLA